MKVIYEAVVGSTVHGLALEGKDDLDLMGVFIEPIERMVGFQRQETIIERSKPDGVPSEPGDTDRTLHSLRKFCFLALKGNPSVLLLLYVPESAERIVMPTGQELRRRRHDFKSLRVVRAHLGYLRHQRERMEGTRAARGRIRRALVEAHGYDCKYAAHALRLGWQGQEFVNTGRLTLPMVGPQRETLMKIRRGEIGKESALVLIRLAEEELEALLHMNPLGLPAEPDRMKVETWMVSVYQRHWDWMANRKGGGA